MKFTRARKRELGRSWAQIPVLAKNVFLIRSLFEHIGMYSNISVVFVKLIITCFIVCKFVFCDYKWLMYPKHKKIIVEANYKHLKPNAT